MTECERLIIEGKLEREFLREEERAGYHVTEKMKKVWAISIDLLQYFAEICKRHNLKFFAICGTTIGAVRHEGFIPWDDDIDVGMPREDYNKLIALPDSEFEHPYFLQTPYSDAYFYNRPFARLRNSNTTGISPSDGPLACNNGIFIDIFPLDPYEDNLAGKYFAFKSKIQSTTAWNVLHHKYTSGNKLIRTILKVLSPVILGGRVRSFAENHDRHCSKLKDAKSVGIQYSFYGSNYKKYVWPKQCFESAVLTPFEYIHLPIPCGYDTMLKISFGDYMVYPPEEIRGKHHEIEFDPDTPYKEYCGRHYGTVYK